jgi:hypothetical protein
LVETDTTGLSSSGLVDPVLFPLHPASAFSTVSSQKPVRALRQAIQDLHFNITVGMLSLAPELVYAQAAMVIAEIRTTENIWTYDWRVLVAAYAIAALLGLLSVLVCVHAMSANGGCGDLGFMRVVATTRASAGLNAAVEGWESGLDPVPERVEKTKVMFGEVLGGGRRRIGFGVGREVASSVRSYRVTRNLDRQPKLLRSASIARPHYY